ncbi:hypothetical protein HMPREF9597_01633 [Cutibacterium acnes HL005PA4]|nr:hypothetical protein HMPREF9574_01257 [Cutibacterium acnes HL074PA1]EFS40443.1 hypothetical protein HMPREF9575_02333 [Cutibacterium acnes HL110PA1]EFS45813.1 hypothetical protein HMPREF9580_01148 [Cutibacterium acnes HL087PA2]EFS60771.1 hypothetical protein HMPREF9605_02167 [Cutibacterium acnes HL036PA2]EFS68460.1 hypothetical protein HMPREF9616_01854 [Cutibacterium acnes HL007PA1]EFS79478.1 hypothetical protein HMPREF9597_01633 [Cutibacterium acnes HL005PA4]EFS83721.1 hypothetical protein
MSSDQRELREGRRRPWNRVPPLRTEDGLFRTVIADRSGA